MEKGLEFRGGSRRKVARLARGNCTCMVREEDVWRFFSSYEWSKEHVACITVSDSFYDFLQHAEIPTPTHSS